jgi:HEAT repeat protein
MEGNMATIRTLGRMPTLGEMKEYYARDDVLSFLYDECRMRNIDIAFRRKRWRINPTSKAHLQGIIEKTIKGKIEPAYKGSDQPLGSVRLAKFDYLSFHFHTSITSDGKLIGYDTIFEADTQGWRRAFEDLVGVIKLLDDFEVCYRIKYSGVRSLHFMIPFEALPKQLNGRPALSQRAEIQRRLQDYFRRYCGMRRAHGGSVMRLAYSLNEDNGLVSLPISSGELSDFRPWESNIHSVTVGKTWHGNIPADASRKTLKFLREVYKDDAKIRKSRSTSRGVLGYVPTGLEIAPKDRSSHAVDSDEASMDKWTAQLRSEEESARVEAAWNLMTAPEPVSVSTLQEGLADENPDVRWYLTEALQKRLDAEAARTAGKMLWDDDQFIRISAIDALALSGEDALQAISDSMSGSVDASMDSTRAIDDIIYAIGKIRPEAESEFMRSFVKPIGGSVARFLLASVSSDRPFWPARRFLRRLRELCRQYDIDESVLFHDAIEAIVPWLLDSFAVGKQNDDPWLPYQRLWTLQEIRKNQAIPMMTMREIANSLDIHDVKIPSNRMTEQEREFLIQTVRGALAEKTLKQKAFILANFLLRGRKRISEPAGKLLTRIREMYPSVEQPISKLVGDTPSRQLSIIANVEREHKLLQDKGIDELIGMLGEGWRMRTAAAQTLAEKCQGDEDIEKVIGALQSKGTKVRMGAVTALGAMMSHHKRAHEAVVEALNAQGRTLSNRPFPRWDVRRTALKIYVHSDPPDAIDVLFHAVDNWRSATARHDAVRELGRYMHDKRVLNKLREIRADEHFSIRARLAAERLLRRVPE